MTEQFHIADWRPITSDEFLRQLDMMQRECDLAGSILQIRNHERDGDQFITSFFYVIEPQVEEDDIDELRVETLIVLHKSEAKPIAFTRVQ